MKTKKHLVKHYSSKINIQVIFFGFVNFSVILTPSPVVVNSEYSYLSCLGRSKRKWNSLCTKTERGKAL